MAGWRNRLRARLVGASLVLALGVLCVAASSAAGMRSEKLGRHLCKTVNGGKFVAIPGFPGEKIDRRLDPGHQVDEAQVRHLHRPEGRVQVVARGDGQRRGGWPGRRPGPAGPSPSPSRASRTSRRVKIPVSRPSRVDDREERLGRVGHPAEDLGRTGSPRDHARAPRSGRGPAPTRSRSRTSTTKSPWCAGLSIGLGTCSS